MKKIWIAAAAIFLIIAFLILANSMIAANHLAESQKLQQQIKELEEANRIQRLYYKALAEDNKVLQQIITEYQLASATDKAVYGVFKSYMDYRLLNNPNLIEYKLQQKAVTDSRGFRKIGEYYMIAIGTGWNVRVGEKVLVVLSTGVAFKAIMGDTKSDAHTDAATHKVTVAPSPDGSVVEFIVDSDKIKKHIGASGTVSTIPEFSGAVIGIYKIEN